MAEFQAQKSPRSGGRWVTRGGGYWKTAPACIPI